MAAHACAYANDAPGRRTAREDFDGSVVTANVFGYNSSSEVTEAEMGTNTYAYAYDHQSRRIRKEVSRRGAETQSWELDRVNTFLYDGWNVIREVRSQNSGVSTNYYTWGLDLSGSLQGAGGVGGLLSVTTVGPNSPSVYYPCYDANGNVTAYLDATGGVAVACTYDAFGKTVACSGPLAGEFAYWFSTKYFDPETGLYYYGYRFYDPELGRWVSRDPIEEMDLPNLYMFIHNSVTAIDSFGLATGYFKGTVEYHMPYADHFGALDPSLMVSCSCKCKKMECDLSFYYTIYVAEEGNRIWNTLPLPYPGEPTPLNWSSWSYSSKRNFIFKHEMKHLYWYEVFYNASKETTLHHEQMSFNSREACDSDARNTEDVIKASYKELRIKQGGEHELWKLFTSKEWE